MERYSRILEKDKREIVLLKSRPCIWGKCSFCDYIEDNDVEDVYKRQVDNSLDISFWDIPNDRYLKICLL